MFHAPAGNNEWSFRHRPDRDSRRGRGGDVASDLFLKIKYLEWGSQRDPFFFKLGNLNDITVGHGLIMRDFANDHKLRRYGAAGSNFGLDFGKIGFEYMVNDVGNLLTLPVIFSDPAFVPDVLTGGRLYFQPFDTGKGKDELKTISDLAFGVSLLVDLGPAVDFYSDVPLYTPADAGKIVFLNPGVDIDLPIFETDFFSIVGFADAALMLPYLRNAPSTALTGTAVPKGFALDAIWNPDADVKFKNYGLAAGLFGNVWFIDWRLEYRYYTGVFKPAFYDTGYERSRSATSPRCSGTSATRRIPPTTRSPWACTGRVDSTGRRSRSSTSATSGRGITILATSLADMDDRLIAKFTFQEIPVVHLSGSFSYERTSFAGALIGGAGMSLFDANTVVKAELAYPLVEDLLDVVLFYTMTPMLKADGTPDYETDGSWLPKMATNLTIETRVSY